VAAAAPTRVCRAVMVAFAALDVREVVHQLGWLAAGAAGVFL
jgi:hypothetical protein